MEHDIDIQALNMLRHITKEERNSLMNLLKLSRTDNKSKDNTNLIMAIFRDIYVFKQMSQATILNYQTEVEQLKIRIEKLEEDQKQ